MSLRILASLALATGLVAAKPISAPESKRDSSIFGGNNNINAIINGNRGGYGGFNFIDGFNNFNQQQQVIQVQEKNLQVVDDGRNRQVVVEQVNQVLVVDQVNNGFNNDLNNLFRRSNMGNRFNDISTVMLVVQEIRISVDDGRGNRVDQQVFAQRVEVANRGRERSQTVMIFDSKTLIAKDILGNNAFQNIIGGAVGGIAGATAPVNNALPTKTAGVQLFGAKPTWSAVAEDPAAALGSVWQNAVQDMQNNAMDGQDMQLNEQVAAEEMKKLDEAKKQDEAKQLDEAKGAQNGTAAAEAAKNGTEKAQR